MLVTDFEVRYFFMAFFAAIIAYSGLLLANMATANGPPGPASALFNL